MMADLEAQLRKKKTHASPEAATMPVVGAAIVSRGVVPPFESEKVRIRHRYVTSSSIMVVTLLFGDAWERQLQQMDQNLQLQHVHSRRPGPRAAWLGRRLVCVGHLPPRVRRRVEKGVLFGAQLTRYPRASLC